jgi:Family of unknown function (DUF6152)
MDMRFRFMIAIGVLLTATSALAHHSFSSEYDSKQPVTLKGLVTKVEWQNPHAYFYINVKDEATGAVTNWALEMGAPSGLQRQGWTRNTLQVGDLVTVEGTRARNGTNLANARNVSKDGKKLGAASSEAQGN